MQHEIAQLREELKHLKELLKGLGIGLSLRV